MPIKRWLQLAPHVTLGLGIFFLCSDSILRAQTNDAKLENYSQWKLALGEGQLADPA